MNSVQLYGVYTVRFPYLESTKFKIRPVVVVSHSYSKHDVVAVVPITSTLEFEQVDSNINNWSKAGLVKPSVARVHRMTTVLGSKLTIQLGSVSVEDTKQLKAALRKFLELSS